MKVFAPGKLILSGEHAVVYGYPALAMAINRYVIATATPDEAPHISFDLADLDYQRHFSLKTLHRLKYRIKEKYRRFVHGDFKIRDVLQRPVELAQVAFSLFFEALNVKLTQGMKIHLQSTIPMGCGMGSSAATILSIAHAITHSLEITLSSETLLRLSLEAENLQHGFSSGLDLLVSLQGGCVYLNEGQIHARSVPAMPFYLINTGFPKTSTGECVHAAAWHFTKTPIGDEFAAVTHAMDMALQAGQLSAVNEAIRNNHRLLVRIGVVPSRVQRFIAEVETIGGCAKICGAGAVAGDQAGAVLVVAEDESALMALCARYRYDCLPIAGESRGVHVV